MSYAPLAQLVEHLTLNQGVQGSSPWRSTRNPSDLRLVGFILQCANLQEKVLTKQVTYGIVIVVFGAIVQLASTQHWQC